MLKNNLSKERFLRYLHMTQNDVYNQMQAKDICLPIINPNTVLEYMKSKAVQIFLKQIFQAIIMAVMSKKQNIKNKISAK